MAASSSRSLWWLKRAAKDDSGAIAADDVAHGLVLTGQFLEDAGLSDDAIITHIDGRIMTAFIRAHKFAAVVKGCCGLTHNSGPIVSCGNRPHAARITGSAST